MPGEMDLLFGIESRFQMSVPSVAVLTIAFTCKCILFVFFTARKGPCSFSFFFLPLREECGRLVSEEYDLMNKGGSPLSVGEPFLFGSQVGHAELDTWNSECCNRVIRASQSRRREIDI